MKKNQKAKKTKPLKTKKAEAKKTKPVKPNNDFIMSGAQNFYMTDNSIAAQRVLSIDKNGKPLAMLEDNFYQNSKENNEFDFCIIVTTKTGNQYFSGFGLNISNIIEPTDVVFSPGSIIF